MEKRLDLIELSKIRTKKYPLITFYFTASSPFEWKEEANIFLKSKASKYEEKLPKELIKSFKEDVEKIKDYRTLPRASMGVNIYNIGKELRFFSTDGLWKKRRSLNVWNGEPCK